MLANHHARRGFTLVESLLAISVLSIAGTAMLVALESSIDVNRAAVERFVAQGLAQTLMDEITGLPYCDLGTSAYQSPLGASWSELFSTGRTGLDDMDDFVDVDESPPKDPWGVTMGRDSLGTSSRLSNFRLPTNTMNRYRWEVDAYYVNSSDLTTKLTGSSTSDYRAYHVLVYVTDPGAAERLVVDLRRVVSYVPAL